MSYWGILARKFEKLLLYSNLLNAKKLFKTKKKSKFGTKNALYGHFGL